MATSERLSLGGSVLLFISVARGLDTNRDYVLEELEAFSPDIIALSVSPEELEGLLHMDELDMDEFALSDYEEMYVEKLRSYSKVVFPPPAYTVSASFARRNRIPLTSLDVNERLFSELYVSLVSTKDLIRHSLRKKRLKKKRFQAEGPEEFAVLWDREVNSLSGFARMAERREEYMARRIGQISKKYGRIAAVVEVERASGVLSRLKSDHSAVPEDEHNQQRDDEQ